MFSPEQASIAKELAKRRVFVFLLVFLLISTGDTINRDTDSLKRIEDYVVAALILAALFVIAVGWRRQALRQLRLQHNIVLGLVLIVLASVALHFSFPNLVFGVWLVANRFL
jgi:hypothetical protein